MKSRKDILGALDEAKALQVQQVKFITNPAEMAVQAGINAPLIVATLGLLLEVALDIRELAERREVGPALRCSNCFTKMAFVHKSPTGYYETGWKTDWTCPKCGQREEQAAPPPGSEDVESGPPAIEVDDCGDPDEIRKAARETLLKAQAEKKEDEK